MPGPAQVRSTDAIDALQAALAKFQERVQNALDSLDGALHRTSDWVDHDRPSYWRSETHRAEEWLTQAKVELARCLMMNVAGRRPACREQKAAVEAAKARVKYCHEKREIVVHWQRNYRHESFEYDGRIGQLRRLLEHDVPKARAVLVKILRRLDEYTVERPPDAMQLTPEESTAIAGAEAIPSAANRPGEDPAASPDNDETKRTPGSPAPPPPTPDP
jgi:hypothetical protein